MSIKLGIVMDSIAAINIKKDTSFAMLLEAQSRGWQLFYMELNDLFMRNGRAFARTRTINVQRDFNQWYEFTGSEDKPLDELDVILMRKDPPLVCREPTRIREFLAEQGEIILKPLDGMGGTSIFHLRQNDPNISVILETMTAYKTRYVMAQRYLPAIKDGDKRILVINGEPVPYCLARIPAQGESRGNLAAGGRAEGRPLSESDWDIARRVGPVLKAKGLAFVGIDVIGDKLTEINVTSPTCVQELDHQFGLNICGLLMDHIENTLPK